MVRQAISGLSGLVRTSVSSQMSGESFSMRRTRMNRLCVAYCHRPFSASSQRYSSCPLSRGKKPRSSSIS
ncbi:MAG: hypothetical protein RSA65_07740, partial [Clostridia bacterium]